MENKKILEVKELLENDLIEKITLKELNDLKVKYLGKKGLITELNSEIKNVLNEEWYNNEENRHIVLVTERGTFTYEVFSVYEDKASDYPITTEFKNDNEYLKFLKTIKKKSKYNFNVDVSEEKSILTLSTCATNNQNRVTLHAINIK